MGEEKKDPPEIEIPPEITGMWEWFKANWAIVAIAVVILALIIAMLRGGRRG